MNSRFKLSILLFLFVNLCNAQDYDFAKECKRLHIECEAAYKLNDFVKMKTTLDARRDFVESGRPDYMSQAEFDSINGMYYKDLGSYYSCLVDVDKTAVEKAKENYQLSLNIFKDSQLLSSPLKAELAQLSYRTGKYAEALAYLESNYDYYSRQFIRPTIVTLSQIALCKAQLGNFEDAVQDIDKAINISGNSRYNIDRRHALQKEMIRKKAKILSLKLENNDESPVEAVGYYEDYFFYIRDSLIVSFNKMNADERERYWLRMQPFITDCYRLEDAAPELLYDLTLFSKSILLQFTKENPGPISPSYKDIQNKLKKKECAIEFVRYERKGIIMLGALVLHKEGTPKFIRICAEKELLNFKSERGIPAKEMFGKRLSYEQQMMLIDELYESKEFGCLVWNKELRKELSGIRKVYFSPDGPFHQLAIEYMYPKKKRMSFSRLTSTRELLAENGALDFTGMFICGGIEYEDAEICDIIAKNDERAYYFIRNNGLNFGYLQGTKEEVESVYKLRDSDKDTLLLGKYATEQKCCELFNKYPVVQIATHGYFGGESEKFGLDIKPRTSDLTMSSSVIILAASMKNVWSENFDPSKPDGILSARELSSMKLDNVALFIVSACQSGLGYVTSDGVYGIQRGLKNAGVKALVVSLWEVDDLATKHFMISLNKALLEEGDIQKAFDKARKKMNSDYKEPRYKNAFILLDGNAN